MTERDLLHRLFRLTIAELISRRAIMSSRSVAGASFLRNAEFSQGNQERRESRKRIIAVGSFAPSLVRDTPK